jgi:tetratricopeptide (TPR) repeat protein
VEAQEQQERLKQQKELRWQRIVSAVIGVIALVALISGGFAYYQRNDAVKAKESLSAQLFQNQIDIGKSFKVDGNYDEALQQLAKADSFALDAAQHGEVEELRGQWSRLSALVAEAEDLRAGRVGWISALKKYEQALAISEDGLLKSKKEKLEDEIAAEYNLLIESARGMRAFTDPCDPRVLKVLEDALLLRPGEKARANEIAGCPHF